MRLPFKARSNMTFLTLLILTAIALWFYGRSLGEPDLAHLDQPRPAPLNAGAPPSAALDEVHARLREMASSGGSFSGKGMAALRARMDELGADVPVDDFRIEPVSAHGVDGEWVRAADSEPDRRLLYLHGGAFTVGSAVSHRRITTELARRLKVSVLAVNYRLMPEHRRLEGIADCQQGYRFILENGPDGHSAPPTALFVAGDSAGGSLTLAIIAWARDVGLHPATAAIALSPTTDSTFNAPSFVANADRDVMLGPLLKPLLKVPRPIALLMTWLSNRVKPNDPRISPLRGSLAELPPILIHASEVEMLLDDGARYVAKAQAAGTDAVLQTWDHMVHVWHIFAPELPEAVAALDEIEAFVARVEALGDRAADQPADSGLAAAGG
ncbi:MAG: alpha/beta hydrolase [Pseudomonadota bacterium]